MVDRLEALGGEVFNEVLTAQTGQKTVWGEKQGCLDCHQIKATKIKVFKKNMTLSQMMKSVTCCGRRYLYLMKKVDFCFLIYQHKAAHSVKFSHYFPFRLLLFLVGVKCLPSDKVYKLDLSVGAERDI